MSVGTIVQVDPTTLLVGANVRKEVNLTKEFTASIKERGVLIPLVAHETPEGLVVDEGQRRTLAAVDMKLATVPVYVREAPTETDRIIDQVVANEHREELTHADGIAAVQELSLFDMKAPAIAKQMGLPREFVDQAVKVGASKVATEAMQERQLSFEVALLLAEFDEYPVEQAELLELGNEWSVKQRAKELLWERAQAPLKAEIEAAGIPLIREPGYGGDPQPAHQLYTDKKKTKRLGDEPREQIVELAGDGLRAYLSSTYEEGERVPAIRYAVKGWKARGLFSHYADSEGATVATTPEEKEALKAERRAARESTAAWKEASVLRIEFLQALVKRKAMPKGWESLVVGRLLDNNSHGSDEWRMAIAILGLQESADKYSLRGVVEDHLKKMPTKALHIGLATYLGSVEGGFEFDRKGWAQKATKAYLRLLEGWGYELTEVERVAAGYKPRKADAA